MPSVDGDRFEEDDLPFVDSIARIFFSICLVFSNATFSSYGYENEFEDWKNKDCFYTNKYCFPFPYSSLFSHFLSRFFIFFSVKILLDLLITGLKYWNFHDLQIQLAAW